MLCAPDPSEQGSAAQIQPNAKPSMLQLSGCSADPGGLSPCTARPFLSDLVEMLQTQLSAAWASKEGIRG